MELAFVVYLISILENIGDWFKTIAIISGFIVMMICYVEFLFHSSIVHKKTVIFLICMVGLFGTLKALLPSEKQAYAIAAAYGAQQAYQSEEAKQIGEKVMKAINAKLDSFAEPEKEKK